MTGRIHPFLLQTGRQKNTDPKPTSVVPGWRRRCETKRTVTSHYRRETILTKMVSFPSTDVFYPARLDRLGPPRHRLLLVIPVFRVSVGVVVPTGLLNVTVIAMLPKPHLSVLFVVVTDPISVFLPSVVSTRPVGENSRANDKEVREIFILPKHSCFRRERVPSSRNWPVVVDERRQHDPFVVTVTLHQKDCGQVTQVVVWTSWTVPVTRTGRRVRGSSRRPRPSTTFPRQMTTRRPVTMTLCPGDPETSGPGPKPDVDTTRRITCHSCPRGTTATTWLGVRCRTGPTRVTKIPRLRRKRLLMVSI